jgi:hypothetical protein
VVEHRGDFSLQSQFNFPLRQAAVRLKMSDPSVGCDVEENRTKMFNSVSVLAWTAAELGKL